MLKIKQLEDKVKELEKRVEMLEVGVGEDPLYNDAKKLVEKHQKTSIIFLQRHLFIDLDRAQRILDRLKKEGVINPTT